MTTKRAEKRWRCRECRRRFATEDEAWRHVDNRHHYLVCGFPPKFTPLAFPA